MGRVEDVRQRVSQLARLGAKAVEDGGAVQAIAGLAGDVSTAPFLPVIGDFYLTNAIARSSAVMAEMSAIKAASAGVARQAAE